jgi:hypothetical protein
MNELINLVISSLVNANASPDMPKPLYQTDSARALRRHDSLRLG